mgnify:CR=1 FL=1
MSERITTRCPSCGGPHLFISDSGALVCSFIECKNPTAINEASKICEQVLRRSTENTRLREAAQKFVAQLDLVHNDETYKGVWMIAHLHLGQYSGPKYADELEALRNALKT